MSASNSIKKKTTCNHWLLVSLFAVFGTSVQASDGLKQIIPNTSSVTSGSSSGAASATSSAGGSATYNSGVDWTKASSVPWKGINWGASGTIPQARIPKLATSQIPTLTQSQLPNAFPSKWASSIKAPKGSLCGWFYAESRGNNNDHFTIKQHIQCNGKTIYKGNSRGYSPSCPSGYGFIKTNNGGNDANWMCYAQ